MVRPSKDYLTLELKISEDVLTMVNKLEEKNSTSSVVCCNLLLLYFMGILI